MYGTASTCMKLSVQTLSVETYLDRSCSNEHSPLYTTSMGSLCYENLWGRSIGLHRPSLFGSCSSSRMGISWFGCLSSLSLWATLCFVTSTRTIGICRSARSSLLGMYHCAFTIVRNTLFWKRCKISILDWEAVLQRGILYVHIGRSIVLYSRCLFAIDSSESKY
jgi:hypothetical protein